MKFLIRITLAICFIMTITCGRLKTNTDLPPLAALVVKIKLDTSAIENLAASNEKECSKYEKNIQGFFNSSLSHKKLTIGKANDFISCKFNCPKNDKEKEHFALFVEATKEKKDKVGRLLYNLVGEKKGLMNLDCKTVSGGVKDLYAALKQARETRQAGEKIEAIKKDPLLNRLYNEPDKNKCADYKDLINARLAKMKTLDGKIDEKCRMKCLARTPSRISSDEAMEIIYIKEFERNNFIYNDNVDLWIGYHASNGKNEFEDCKVKYANGDE